MSEFHELIKKFSKCRDYVRDFFVYGFKSRDDFNYKSSRTYDDERRRIESWLQEYVCQDYQETSKNISLQMDSNLLDTNPLYRVWKTKSFTDADIVLHFYLLDLLQTGEWLSVNELTDQILDKYEADMDPQMVRRKCKEYEKEGLLLSRKQGKTVLYHSGKTLNNLLDSIPDMEQDSCRSHLLDAISFFQFSAPFGMIGSTLADEQFLENRIFRIKHSFLVHTLEDEILLVLTEAMKDPAAVRMTTVSAQGKSEQIQYGLPLRIFVSTRTGRRYLCFYQWKRRSAKGQFHSIRLDQIKTAEFCSKQNTPDPIYTFLEQESSRYEEILENLNRNQHLVWGISFQGNYRQASSRSRRQTIHLTLHINEEYEQHILHRLEREGKDGTITRLAQNTYLYERTVFDAQEMVPWLRTFICRIIELSVTEANTDETTSPVADRQFANRFNRDLQKMYQIYDIE